MSTYYQRILLDDKIETFTFGDAYDKYIVEGICGDGTEGWQVLENPYTESQVQQFEGIEEITLDEFISYFIPGTRPGRIPRP